MLSLSVPHSGLVVFHHVRLNGISSLEAHFHGRRIGRVNTRPGLSARDIWADGIETDRPGLRFGERLFRQLISTN